MCHQRSRCTLSNYLGRGPAELSRLLIPAFGAVGQADSTEYGLNLDAVTRERRSRRPSVSCQPLVFGDQLPKIND
jgi:hypothetical protein